MKVLQYFLMLLFLGAGLQVRASDRIEGRILKIESQIFIYINPGDRLIPLKALNPVDVEALKHLESGDFVTGQGVLTDKEAQLESLYFVGLQKLLGLWRSESWELFEFRSYEDLRFYWSTDWPSPKNSDLKTKNYAYNLAPSKGTQWAMLLVGDRTVDLAQIQFKNDRLLIQLLDRQNGRVLKTYQLTPIALEAPSR
jgi:hypothetical protein